MLRYIGYLTTLIATTATVLAQNDKTAAKDRFGDPLPQGAVARLGTTRLRHTSGWRLVDAAFSRDGKILASFGGDNHLRLWDTRNGKELQNTLLKDVSSLDVFSPAVAFSSDDKTVAVSSHREIALCEIGRAEPRLLPQHPDYVTGTTFSPDGKLLAVYGSAKTVSLLDPATGKEVRKLTGHEKSVFSAAFSADGKTLATTSEDFTCRIWSVNDGKQKHLMKTNKLRAPIVVLSPDAQFVAWWDEEPKIHIRDIASGKEQVSFKAGGALFILDWRQCAMRFASDNTLHALYWSLHHFHWHPERGLKTRAFEPVSGKTAFGRIAPDGKWAALWDWDHGTALHLLDLETGKEKIVAEGHLKMVRGVAAQPGGQLIASTSTDGTVRLWHPDSRELHRWRPECTFLTAVFTPDGKFLAHSAYDGKRIVRIVDLDQTKEMRRFETERSHVLAFSRDGRLMLGADFTRIEVWDFVNGQRLCELEDVPETRLPVLKLSSRGPWLSYTIHALTVSPNGKFAAAAFTRTRGECSIYMWDTDTGKKRTEWSGRKDARAPIAFSPDGKVFASAMTRGKSEEVVFWDIAKQEIVKRFPSADISCHRLAFSGDGKLLALAGYYKGIVQVYDVASGIEIARFQPHNGPASLAFSDDSKTLITGGDDTAILIWDVKSFRDWKK
jgi:WD40 repeat protein